MSVRYYTSTAEPTTLSTNISASSTSFQVGSLTGFPPLTPFTIALDYGNDTEELCDVTNVSGTTITVVRGVDGTTAADHSLSAPVRHVSSARDFTEANQHINSSSAVHGLVAGSNVVGTLDTQTLSNKTLNSPSISGNVAVTGSISVQESGDTAPRFQVTQDGVAHWGDGTNPADVNLYRSAANVLKTDDMLNTPQLQAYSANSASTPLSVRGAAGQTFRLAAFTDSTPNVLVGIAANGATTFSPQAVAAVPITINAPTGVTADLQDWQINGSTVANIDNLGRLNVNANINSTATVTGGEIYSNDIVYATKYLEKVGQSWQVVSTYLSGWSGATSHAGVSGWNVLQYRIDGEDNLYLEGAFHIIGSAASVVCTLPTGYYNTSKNIGFTCSQYDGTNTVTGQAYVNSIGNLHIDLPAGFTRASGNSYYICGRAPLGNMA